MSRSKEELKKLVKDYYGSGQAEVVVTIVLDNSKDDLTEDDITDITNALDMRVIDIDYEDNEIHVNCYGYVFYGGEDTAPEALKKVLKENGVEGYQDES